MKRLEDNFILIYCFILFNLAFLFLGFEISEMRHDTEIRLAQKKILNCQYLITKGALYE